MQQPYETPLQCSPHCHHSGLDASPNVVGEAPLTAPEIEVGIPHEKNFHSVRNCKSNSQNMLLNTNTSGESRKAASDCENNVSNTSQGAANVTERLSDESEDIDQDLSATKKKRFNQMNANGETAQKNVTVWHGDANPDSLLQDSVENKVKKTPSLRIIFNASGTGAMLTKDKLELRKDKKRQANRESARRSRMRKQEELKNLLALMEKLKAQSSLLKDQLLNLSEECGKIKDENDSLMEELKQMDEPEAIAHFMRLVNGESSTCKQVIPSKENSAS